MKNIPITFWRFSLKNWRRKFSSNTYTVTFGLAIGLAFGNVGQKSAVKWKQCINWKSCLKSIKLDFSLVLGRTTWIRVVQDSWDRYFVQAAHQIVLLALHWLLLSLSTGCCIETLWFYEKAIFCDFFSFPRKNVPGFVIFLLKFSALFPFKSIFRYFSSFVNTFWWITIT